jgi:peptidoglycan/xylan/chitin deacetylase (PgdA/CDA1 family)
MTIPDSHHGSFSALSREQFESVVSAALSDHEFALCLTHDVDRPYKRHQALYYALRERSRMGYHLRTALPDRNPYWQFEEIMALEADLGVRSAFYFLQEPHLLVDGSPRDWLSPENWIQFLGRYDVREADIAAAIEALDDGGWEVGLHGSILAHDDRDRLAEEKAIIEEVLGDSISGGRQHYLRLDGTRTWRNQADIGLRYDASLGSSTEYGFEHGYVPQRPFDDAFVEFPLTLMEVALPNVSDETDRAIEECERLLSEAARNDAVMTVLWHPRYFNPDEFPGYRQCYRALVERAIEMDAWVGTPDAFYDRLVTAAAASTPVAEEARQNS